MRLKVYKFVVLDWHGVLDKGHFAGVLGRALEVYTQVKSVSKFRAYIKALCLAPKYNGLYKKYNLGLVDPDVFWRNVEQDIGRETANVFKELVINFASLDETWRFVSELNGANFRLGILSDCPKDKYELIQTMKDKLEIFEVALFSCEEGLMKNRMEFFELFEEKAGVKAENILFLDDNPKNVKMARKKGWKAEVFHPSKIQKIRSIVFEG